MLINFDWSNATLSRFRYGFPPLPKCPPGKYTLSAYRKKYIEHLFVRAVKNYAQGFVEYQFLSNVIRFKPTSYLPFLSFACSLKLFPLDTKGLVLKSAELRAFSSDRSLQNAFV